MIVWVNFSVLLNFIIKYIVCVFIDILAKLYCVILVFLFIFHYFCESSVQYVLFIVTRQCFRAVIVRQISERNPKNTMNRPFFRTFFLKKGVKRSNFYNF